MSARVAAGRVAFGGRADDLEAARPVLEKMDIPLVNTFMGGDGAKTPDQAMAACMFETVGQA